MNLFTAEQIRRFAPLAKPEIVDVLVNRQDDIIAAGITVGHRLNHFMSEIATETGGLRSLEENLNYKAERLMKVWPARFPTLAAAKPYAGNPQKLANKVYGGRLGNKNANDGWIYRGGGMIQTTGLDNYRRAGFEKAPEKVRTPDGGLTAALKFWTDNKLNALADKDNIVLVRRRVNGGEHGLDDCKAYYRKAKSIFTGADEEAAPSLTRDAIRSYQRKLIELGYVEVGDPDGLVGEKTIGAISMFQAANGLMLTGEFDAETRERLFTAPVRVVQRSKAAPEDSRIIAKARNIKKTMGGTIVAVAGAALQDPIEAVTGVSGWIAKVKSALSPLEGLGMFAMDHWYVIAGAAAIGLYLWAKDIEDARIEDHETGRTA